MSIWRVFCLITNQFNNSHQFVPIYPQNPKITDLILSYLIDLLNRFTLNYVKHTFSDLSMYIGTDFSHLIPYLKYSILIG